MGNKDDVNMVCGLTCEGLEGVKDIMEALLNLAALDFSIQPDSFQALVMLRIIHENNLGGEEDGLH